MRITSYNFDPVKIIVAIIVIIGWAKGHMNWWIAVPLLLLMVELNFKWNR